MARRIQSLAVAAAAVASTAAIVAAVPAAPSQAYTPTRLSTAKYELTALSDITIAGITKAYWQGYGGYIGSCCDLNGDPFDSATLYPTYQGPADPYYGNSINGAVEQFDPVTLASVGFLYNQSPVTAAGVPGVLYYLSNNVISTFLPNFNLQNYYFEVAQVTGAGLPAVIYVAASESPRNHRRHGRRLRAERRVLRAVGVRLGDVARPEDQHRADRRRQRHPVQPVLLRVNPGRQLQLRRYRSVGHLGLLQQLAGPRGCRDCSHSGRGDQRQRSLDSRQGDRGDQHRDAEAARSGDGQRVGRRVEPDHRRHPLLRR